MAGRRQNRQGPEFIDAVPDFAGIAHIDRIARQPLDGPCDIGAAYCTRDDLLDVGNVESVSRGRHPVDIDIDIATARQPLGQRGTHARHGLGDTLHIECNAFQLIEIVA